MAAFIRRAGGSMLESTGTHRRGVVIIAHAMITQLRQTYASHDVDFDSLTVFYASTLIQKKL